MTPKEKRALKEIVEYVHQHEDEITDEESRQRLVQQFMDEYKAGLAENSAAGNEDTLDAEYYIDRAYAAASAKKKKEYFKKAAELEPDNADVQRELIMCDFDTKPHECLKALEELIQKETKNLDHEGYYEEVGDEFSTIFVARPIVRVRECYLCALIDLGMMHRAIDEAKDTLRLCVVDDLSIRYKLMHLYAYIEDELHAVALHKKYGEKDETQMLLPLAILYYKLGDEEKAEEYIHRLAAKNKDTKEFLTNFANHWEEIMFEHLEGQSLWRYIPFSYSEFMYELNQCRFLFFPVPEFPKWALQHLPKRSRKKKSSKDEENS